MESHADILDRINTQSAHLGTRRHDKTVKQPSAQLKAVTTARTRANRGQVPMAMKASKSGGKELRLMNE